MNRLEFTPDPTLGDAPLVLEPNEVFVFGANSEGAHGGGSAYAANKFYGAVWGEIHRTGRSYGIVTLTFPTGMVNKDQKGSFEKTRITNEDLAKEFELFFATTQLEPEKTFYLTKVGLGIAGWELDEVLEAFNQWYMPSIHTNVVLPVEFAIKLNSLKK
jgi:hypothetical protein